MIKKALFTALVLLGIHALYVGWDSSAPFGQYPQQENNIKAQQFIYGDSIDDVIIGSSQANRMVMDSLPGVFNLSFAGRGIFDGLSIISNYQKFPKNIFIEMNLALREEDKSFTSQINSPWQYHLRKRFPSLRDEYQPVALVSKPLLTSRLLQSRKKEHSVEEAEHRVNPYEDKLFMQMLNQEIERMSVEPESELLTRCFRALKERVDELEENNVTVVFFEMPIDKNLCDLNEPRIIRETFYKIFPPSQYGYIKMPDCENYVTTDGTHLPEGEALKYTQYFRHQSLSLLARRSQK